MLICTSYQNIAYRHPLQYLFNSKRKHLKLVYLRIPQRKKFLISSNISTGAKFSEPNINWPSGSYVLMSVILAPGWSIKNQLATIKQSLLLKKIYLMWLRHVVRRQDHVLKFYSWYVWFHSWFPCLRISNWRTHEMLLSIFFPPILSRFHFLVLQKCRNWTTPMGCIIYALHYKMFRITF